MLLDTNIVLYLLGSNEVVQSLSGKLVAVSEISEIELLSYPKISIAEEQVIIKFLGLVRVIPMSPEIRQKTIEIRRKYHFRIPDSIIVATAWEYGVTLVTNDLALHRVTEIEVIGLEDLITKSKDT